MWNRRSYARVLRTKKVKIKLFNTHFAWIYDSLLKHFDRINPELSRIDWIKRQAEKDFDIRLTEKSDIVLLDNLVKKSYYIDKTDWLREKMRETIREEEKDWEEEDE